MTTHASKKRFEKVPGRVLGKGFSEGVLKGGLFVSFTVKKGSENGFLDVGFQKVPRTPLRRV